MDTGSSSHLNSSSNNLSKLFNTRLFPSVHVGDENYIPVTNTGHSIIPSSNRPLHLHNVLETPNIIKNLIFVRQFTRDNNCTIEFDAFGFSMKDFWTRHILLRWDSFGDLYPVTKPSTLPTALLSTSSSMWHQRVGHPGDEVLRSLVSRQFISCNKEKSSHVCHACQLERMIRTINNVIRTLLFQAHLPPTFWVEALRMAAYLINLLPSTAINNEIPYTRLFNKTPDYSNLRIFGCLCYPHLYSPHKLAPCATPCIFWAIPPTTVAFDA
nr:ribonuclease H-like domain-containing protein [Tanacetum cinerariifolium]